MTCKYHNADLRLHSHDQLALRQYCPEPSLQATTFLFHLSSRGRQYLKPTTCRIDIPGQRGRTYWHATRPHQNKTVLDSVHNSLSVPNKTQTNRMIRAPFLAHSFVYSLTHLLPFSHVIFPFPTFPVFLLLFLTHHRGPLH